MRYSSRDSCKPSHSTTRTQAILVLWTIVFRLQLEASNVLSFFDRKRMKLNSLVMEFKKLLFEGEMKRSINEIQKIQRNAEQEAMQPISRMYPFVCEYLLQQPDQ